MNCLICNSDHLSIVYNGKIRSGSYGNYTKRNYIIYYCNNCKIRFLDKFVNDDFYETKEYREKYNGSSLLDNFRKLHDDEQNYKISRIGIQNCRDKVIADFGAGGGLFLDAVYGFAKSTIAVEPAKFYHPALKEKHKVFTYARELIDSGIKVDIATSFAVIEHVQKPDVFLRDIYDSLKPGGVLYLLTPNYDEILNDLVKEKYDPFNYRDAHLYYFCKDAMTNLIEKVGYQNYSVTFYHKYDMSNMIYWLKEGKPTGNNLYTLFDGFFNLYYCDYLEKQGKASHLWVKAIK